MSFESLNLNWTPGLVALAVGVSVSTLASWAWLARQAYRREPILPDEGLPLVPWTGRTVTLILASWFLFQMLAFLVVVRLAGQPRTDEPPQLSAVQMISVMLLANALAIATVPGLVRVTSGDSCWRDLGLSLRNRPWRNLGRGYLACFAVLPIVYAVYAAALKLFPPSRHVMEQVLSPDHPALKAVLAIASGVLIGPIAEELLFRGILMTWFARVLSGYPVPEPDEPRSEKFRLATDWQPNLAAALVWAAIHNWPTPIPLLVLGLALGWVYQRTGSLLAPIGLHMTFNGLSALYLLVSESTTVPGAGGG